jgi:YfiH family protein
VGLAAPFYEYGEHYAIDFPGAHAAFTTRRGGHSGGPFTSLNLGRLTDDDPALVQRNRETVEAQVSRPLAFVRQVHGTTIQVVDEADAERARTATPDEMPRADGQVTRGRAVAVAALTADCLPIAVAADGVVAMLHAGWRGLSGGVIAAGVATMRRAGAQGSMRAAVGPGAGRCCYEVGDEVLAAFSQDAAAVCGERNLDLKGIARRQLESCGVDEVHDVGLCTICSDPTLLFSHRRDRGVTGRQAGIAWLS